METKPKTWTEALIMGAIPATRDGKVYNSNVDAWWLARTIEREIVDKLGTKFLHLDVELAIAKSTVKAHATPGLEIVVDVDHAKRVRVYVRELDRDDVVDVDEDVEITAEQRETIAGIEKFLSSVGAGRTERPLVADLIEAIGELGREAFGVYVKPDPELFGALVFYNDRGKPTGWFCELDDGRDVYLHPQTYGAYQLAIAPKGGDGMTYDDAFDYPDLNSAIVNALKWNGDGEPDGWHRHKLTNRYRPEGDKEREHHGTEEG